MRYTSGFKVFVQDLRIIGVVERLLGTHPGMELWWDSSPLVFNRWASHMVAGASPALRGQIDRLFSEQDPASGLFSGCTTNPSLALAAVQSDPDYWSPRIDEIVAAEPRNSLEALAWQTYQAVIRKSAEMMQPLWQASGGRRGFVSGQVDPRRAADSEAMYRQALELASLAPNVMVKVPATQPGVEVARRLISMGISTNVTMCFTLAQILAAARAAQEGLEIAARGGVDTSRCRSVVTYFMARLIEQPALLQQCEQPQAEVTDIDRKWFGIAVFKRACELLREGGYPSKLVLCSVRKGPRVDGMVRFRDIEEFAGGNIIFTLPPQALETLFELDGNLVFDPDAIRRPVPRASLDRTLKLSYCRQAYEPNGLSPEHFLSHPGMMHMLKEFCGAAAGLEDYLGQRLAVSKAAP